MSEPVARVVQDGDAEDDFARLAAKITSETAFRCTDYKDRCVRRRIAVRMRARGATSYAAYAHVLDTDAHEYERLIETLTVNVTRFFRDRSAFELLEREVVPALWSRGTPLHCWSAGTASGEEAYSIAALLLERARAEGELSRLRDVHVLGTDIDRPSLVRALRGEYAAPSFSETPEAVLDRLFPQDGILRAVTPELRALVHFARHDLLGDPPPDEMFDLVACRNVIIYLDRSAQEELLFRLHAALRPGGYLLLGRVEAILGPQRRLFEAVSARDRVYRRRR